MNKYSVRILEYLQICIFNYRLGNLFDEHCLYCGAYYWTEEKLRSSNMYTTCCSKGAIQFPFIDPPNELMQALFTGKSSEAKLFQKNIRKYNTSLSFASCLFQEPQLPSRGPPVIIVCGNILHKIGSVYPDPTRIAAYMQCYFYSEGGTENEYFQFTRIEVSKYSNKIYFIKI